MGRLSLEAIAPEAKERHLPVRRQLLFSPRASDLNSPWMLAATSDGLKSIH